eukprot:14199929-Alexandrium_andersonii.AAC.1
MEQEEFGALENAVDGMMMVDRMLEDGDCLLKLDWDKHTWGGGDGKAVGRLPAPSVAGGASSAKGSAGAKAKGAASAASAKAKGSAKGSAKGGKGS